MSNGTDKAHELHEKGFNCAQAVACAFADRVGADETTLFRICEGHGGGLGCRKGTCGALLGACTIAGLKMSCGDTENPTSKAETYAVVGRMTESFEEHVGSITCGVIKGLTGGPQLVPCSECIRYSAQLVEDLLF